MAFSPVASRELILDPGVKDPSLDPLWKLDHRSGLLGLGLNLDRMEKSELCFEGGMGCLYSHPFLSQHHTFLVHHSKKFRVLLLLSIYPLEIPYPFQAPSK